ncbi:hypothetical protein CcI49_03025 [Frankia sp. CcI49]|nr:hypothetical protein CcI49_03025 [Frankia sp. CcI49]
MAGGAAVLAGAVAWLGGQGGWAAVLVSAGVLLAVLPILLDRAATRAGDLDIEKVADRLADLVRDQWDIEATRRGVGRPPLEVFWQAADADLVHTWPELLQQAATGRSGPASATPGGGPDDLAGHGALLAAYDLSPCGRLVVLGEPGAGKTVLLLRLVLDLLGRRQPGQPVPLLVPLASWNPDSQSLYAWLEGQILREYPHLTAVDAATGRKRAGALLDAGLILPVLDGLDEIRAGGRDQALAAINEGLRGNVGLVLSCRADEFREAVHPDPGLRPIHLDGAAGIQLKHLGPEAVRGYLLAGAGNDGPGRWAQVLAALNDPTAPVAQALTTPLTANLANTIYNPRPRESSIGLPSSTDLTALPTAEAVEQHLLAQFIPAAYRPHRDQPARRNAEQATRYLAFLAHHLEHRLNTTSLAWWEIPLATPRALPVLAIALAVGLAVGFMYGFAAGIALGTALGLTFGLRSLSPRRVALRRPRPTNLAGGFAVGFALGFALGLAVGLTGGIAAGVRYGLAVGLAVGFTLGITFGLGLDSPTDTQLAAAPTTTLAQDRTSALTSALTYGIAGALALGLTVGLASGLTYGIRYGLVFGLTAGPVFGIAVGIAFGLRTAWGHLVLARPWLAASRQQPLQLIAFLEDAHARGVLRQAGAVWEFRHASLQRYLAGPP